MREEIRGDILRFEAMVDLCDPFDAEECARDRQLYAKEYAVPRTPDGQPISSPAKTVRFLVEVCGYSYDESLAAVVEDMRGWPRRPAVASSDAEAEARNIRNTDGLNIIETLFDLKVVRLAYPEDDIVQQNSRRLMRSLIGLAAIITNHRSEAGGASPIPLNAERAGCPS